MNMKKYEEMTDVQLEKEINCWRALGLDSAELEEELAWRMHARIR